MTAAPRQPRERVSLLRRGIAAAFAIALITVAAAVIVDMVDARPDIGLPPLIVRAGAARGGNGTGMRPFASIQRALQVARPGQTVRVGAGTYREPLQSVRDGRRNAPIRVVGDSARIVGTADTNHLIEIRHDYVEIHGFDISRASTLIAMTHVRGARVKANTIHEAGGECVRLRYFSVGNEIAHNRIRDCGRDGFDLSQNRKNGEGIYIGTAPEQLDRNPSAVPDHSNANWIHHNHITTPAECVDVKEDAYTNLVADNRCRGSRDPEGAGLSSRGIRTTFRGNDSGGHEGAGVRLGGDDSGDGIDNVVTGNHLHDNGHTGVKVIRRPQGLICGNRVERNRDGAINVGDIDPTRRCRTARAQ